MSLEEDTMNCNNETCSNLGLLGLIKYCANLVKLKPQGDSPKGPDLILIYNISEAATGGVLMGEQ